MNSTTYMVCRSCQDRLRVRGRQDSSWSFARADDVGEWLDRHRGCSAGNLPARRPFDFVNELGGLALREGRPNGTAEAGSADDLGSLIEALIPFAEAGLRASGKVEPFAAALYGKSGMIILADLLEGEEASTGELASCLTRYLEARAADGLLSAGALCEYDVSEDEALSPARIRVRAVHPSGSGIPVEIPLGESSSTAVALGPPLSRLRWSAH